MTGVPFDGSRSFTIGLFMQALRALLQSPGSYSSRQDMAPWLGMAFVALTSASS